jgi:hypothetical protein
VGGGWLGGWLGRRRQVEDPGAPREQKGRRSTHRQRHRRVALATRVQRKKWRRGIMSEPEVGGCNLEK